MSSDSQDEMTLLRQKIARLEKEVNHLTFQLSMLGSILDSSPSVVYLKDADGKYLYVNERYRQVFNLTNDQIVGHSDYDFLPAHVADSFRTNDIQVVETNTPIETEEMAETPVGIKYYLSVKFPIVTEEGSHVAGISTDITERKQFEQKQLELQQQIINVQETALAELSTPLIPITDDILVMPLIGTIDSHRASQMLERLLNGVSELRVQTVIIDITGVPIVDTQVANLLLQATKTVRLLGVDVKLTGIRPEVAQTIVSLGINIDVATHSTLQQGIARTLLEA